MQQVEKVCPVHLMMLYDDKHTQDLNPKFHEPYHQRGVRIADNATGGERTVMRAIPHGYEGHYHCPAREGHLVLVVHALRIEEADTADMVPSTQGENTESEP